MVEAISEVCSMHQFQGFFFLFSVSIVERDVHLYTFTHTNMHRYNNLV